MQTNQPCHDIIRNMLQCRNTTLEWTGLLYAQAQSSRRRVKAHAKAASSTASRPLRGRRRRYKEHEERY